MIYFDSSLWPPQVCTPIANVPNNLYEEPDGLVGVFETQPVIVAMKDIRMATESIGCFSIREMENNVNTYIIHHILQKDLTFHITLEELRPNDIDTSVDLTIKRLNAQFINLYKNRTLLSYQLQPCSQLCNYAKKYLSVVGPEETILSLGATFWSLYFHPYLKPFRLNKKLNLFYIRKFNRSVDKIKHLNETPFRINRLSLGNRPNDILPIQYNCTSFNEQRTFCVETNKSTINSRKQSKVRQVVSRLQPLPHEQFVPITQTN